MGRGYALERDPDGRVDFIVGTSWGPRLRTAFERSGATGIVANYAKGFMGDDLEFLRDLSIERLNVLNRSITDISPIHDLAHSLKELRVQVGQQARIDLTLLTRLHLLSCSWAQVADSIGYVDTLEDLFLGEYDPPSLEPLSHLTPLRSLRMKGDPALRTLDGVEAFPWLARLEIYAAPLVDTLHCRGCARRSSRLWPWARAPL